MKRLKIKGITGMPLFLTRFQGYLDGKCGAVVWRDDGWHSHYIENKRAIYDAFVHKLYTNLENKTSALRMESAELVVEHETVKKKLSQPEVAAEGVTIAILARNTGRISAEQNRLQARLQEIELRLSAIDETLTADEQRLLQYLRTVGEGQINHMAVELDCPAATLSALLVELEFKGYVTPFPGGVYRPTIS